MKVWIHFCAHRRKYFRISKGLSECIRNNFRTTYWRLFLLFLTSSLSRIPNDFARNRRNVTNKKNKTKRALQSHLSLSANLFMPPESYSHVWLLKGSENLFLHVHLNRLNYCNNKSTFLVLYTVKTRRDKPLASGDRKSRLTRAAPVSCPISVILLGSPPKEPMFFLTQLTPAAMSLIAKFAPSESVLSKVVLVLKKPETRERYLYFAVIISFNLRVVSTTINRLANPIEKHAFGINVSLKHFAGIIPSFNLTGTEGENRPSFARSKWIMEMKGTQVA